MGHNDKGEPYNDIATILRDGTTVEKHIERAAGTSLRSLKLVEPSNSSILPDGTTRHQW
jgi:hypothetical protein